MRLVILHYHLFKNAGSTIEEVLNHSFHDRFRRLETAEPSGVLTDRELLRYLCDEPETLAVSSHQIRYPMPRAAGFLFFDVCFVRDPLDRLRSFYDYFRQRPDPRNPISDLANECSLGDFAARMIREQALFVRDNQVNLLACDGNSDEPGERDLELAIRRFRAASFAGVVDRFDESVAGAGPLRQAFPELELNRAPVNVSKGLQGTLEERTAEFRNACAAPVFEELLRMTELDRRLVEAARVEVTRRGRETEFAGKKPGMPEGPRHGALDRWMRKRKLRGVFDAAFYLEHNPDVRAAGIDPFRHYLAHGAAEDRAPHPLFNPRYYRTSVRSPIPADVNPLEHFLEAGASAASPHPLFHCEAYRLAFPEVTERNCNPLEHYLRSGQFRNEGNLEVQNARVRVAVREDTDGIAHWTAEPQQLPFLRAVGIDQFRG